MRKIVAEKNIDSDPKKIIERSNELIRKWKCLLEVPTHEGSDEETSPNKKIKVEGESPQTSHDEQEADVKKNETFMDID